MASDKSQSAARHTYDVGYQKWEKYNDEISDINTTERTGTTSNLNPIVPIQTPATIIQSGLPTSQPSAPVPRARGVANTVDSETMERDRGNDEFKNGNFSVAVKQYTKCLGLKTNNYIAFSNRAMAYLKLKEYLKAETDCTCALKINSEHVKSLCRRATARNSLGKHRAAVADLLLAQEYEPSSKAIKSDLAKARELLRNAVNRAPLVPVKAACDSVPEEDIDIASLQGPDLPLYNQHESMDNELNLPNDEKMVETVPPPTPPESTRTHGTRQHDEVQTEPNGVSPIREQAPKIKKKSSSKNKPVSAGGYDLERSLRIYKGQVGQMENYLDSLKLSEVPKLMSNLMEGDVIAMLLHEIGELFGVKRNEWAVVVAWFEAVSKGPSFRLLISLITASDKARLKALLTRCCKVVCDGEEDLVSKVDALIESYQL